MSWFEVEVNGINTILMNLNDATSKNNSTFHKAVSNLFLIPAYDIKQFEPVPDYNDIDFIRGLHSTTTVCIYTDKGKQITARYHKQITEGEIYMQLLRLYKEAKDKQQFIKDLLYGTLIEDISTAEKLKGSIVYHGLHPAEGEGAVTIFTMQGSLVDMETKQSVSVLDLYQTIFDIATGKIDVGKPKYDGLTAFVYIQATTQSANHKTEDLKIVRDYTQKIHIGRLFLHVFTNGLPIYVTQIDPYTIKLISGATKPKYFASKTLPRYSVSVISLSGGLDSSLTLFEYVFTRMLFGIRFLVQPLYFDYGHRTADIEYSRAKLVVQTINQFIQIFADMLGYDANGFIVNEPMRVDISALSSYLSSTGSVLFGNRKSDTVSDQAGTAAYVSNRNDIMLSIAASVLESLYLQYLSDHNRDEIESVLMLGANLSDGLAYRDNAPLYIKDKEQTLKESLMRVPNLLFFCPFVNATKTTFLSRDWFVHMITNYLMPVTEIDVNKSLEYAALYNTWKRQVTVKSLSCRYAAIENGMIVTSLDRLKRGEIELTQLSGPEASRLIAFKLNGIEL